MTARLAWPTVRPPATVRTCAKHIDKKAWRITVAVSDQRSTPACTDVELWSDPRRPGCRRASRRKNHPASAAVPRRERRYARRSEGHAFILSYFYSLPVPLLTHSCRHPIRASRGQSEAQWGLRSRFHLPTWRLRPRAAHHRFLRFVLPVVLHVQQALAFPAGHFCRRPRLGHPS